MASIPETAIGATPQAPPIPPPDVDLIDSDGVPMDNGFHRTNMNVLIEQVDYHRRERRDYFCGGNMFVYFSEQRARNRDFRGPDFFYVSAVPYDPMRRFWVVWKEDGRYPDVIIEFLSPTTEVEDRTTKKDVYEKVFRTPEYYLYDTDTHILEGYRHNGRVYARIQPDARGFLSCEELGLRLGPWTGAISGHSGTYLRFFDLEGNVIPLFAEAERQRADAVQQRANVEQERAEAAQQRADSAQQQADAARQHADAERQRADAERQRAELAEAELARLKAMLGEGPKP
jgi:Uma2 family endonuclease